MGTAKDVLTFCNAAIFCDFKNIGIFDELNQARRCIINIFHETIPVNRRLINLSIIGVVILNNNDNDIENVFENIDDLRSNLFFMIGFEKVVKDDVDKGMN